MNIAKAKQKTIMYIREYSNAGELIEEGQNLDYLLSMNNCFDTAQKEIATVKPIYKKYTVTQNPIPNLLGFMKGFDVKQHLDTDVQIIANGAKSYYFEVDNTATIYVEEEQTAGVWTILETITHTPTNTEFIAYKGLITALSASNNIRLRFSGSYPYNFRNTALYAYTFASANDVPVYTRYVFYDLPSNFYKLQQVVYTNEHLYEVKGNFKFEGRSRIGFNYYDKGQFDVYYYAYPSDIEFDPDDSKAYDAIEFEIDIEAQELIPFYAGYLVMNDENPTLAFELLQQYYNKLNNLTKDENIGLETIDNVDGW